jgi:hypothetical protein
MRRVLIALLIVVVLNVAGAIGYAGFAGMLKADRIASAYAALRGDKAAPAEELPAPPAEVVRPVAAPADTPADLVRLELAQREADLRNQWELIRAAQLQLLRDREEFEREKKEVAAIAGRRLTPDQSEGYKKEIEYLSTIKPKQAKDFLRLKKDADAVDILLAVDPRVGRKIIDACKSQEDRLWMGRILEQLRQRNDGQAEALAAGAQ